MKSFSNKDIVKNFFIEVYNNRNLEYVLEYFSDDYFEHRESGARSKEDATKIIKGAFTIFRDLSCSVDSIISEGNRVYTRLTFTGTHTGEFLGVQPTGKHISFEAMEEFVLEEGKITESWGAWPLHDILELFKQKRGFNMKNVNDVLKKLDEYWAPVIVGEMNDTYIKVAKIKGEFVEHDHKNTDELFYVLKGTMTLQYKDKVVTLNEGDVHVVKKGLFHKPMCDEECHIMLIESKETKHTGDVVSLLTKSVSEQQR